jgi:hypothetical protein
LWWGVKILRGPVWRFVLFLVERVFLHDLNLQVIKTPRGDDSELKGGKKKEWKKGGVESNFRHLSGREEGGLNLGA